MAHDSSSVAFEVYRPLLAQASRLLPSGVKVVLLADRGFCDTKLMKYLTNELAWHYRIRIKANLRCHLGQGAKIKLARVSLAAGEARFWQGISLTAKRYGPVSLALGRPYGSVLRWLVVSDEPTSSETFVEYGLRFRLEEEFLDEKSNGFQLEDTRLLGAAALNRLCLVLAVASLYLVVQGSEVVRQGRRREVDPHRQRGSSYLKLGWRYLRRFFSGVAYPLPSVLRLTGEPDPEAAMASKTQHAKPSKSASTFSTSATLKSFLASRFPLPLPHDQSFVRQSGSGA
ncbi:MAG: transposase [Deinococcota bacterium]|nr:transposase [Deinococcota bacterium]